MTVDINNIIITPVLGGAGDAFGKMVINHTLRSASTAGSNCFLSLYLTSPCASDIGTEVADTWGAYSRLNISGSFLVNMLTGSSANHKDMFFATATGSWGAVKYWGITNGSGRGHSGSLLFWGPIGGFAYTVPSTFGNMAGELRSTRLGRYVNSGERLSFSASSFVINMQGSMTPVLSGSILNHYLNNVRLSSSMIPARLGLYYDYETGDWSGSAELAGNIGYQRLLINGSSAGLSGSWVSPDNILTPYNMSYNTSNFTFTYDAPQIWDMSGAFIVTSASGGEILFRLPFDSDKQVLVDGGFMFSASNLKIKIE